MADILTQDEVDLLLSAVSEGDVGARPVGEKEAQRKTSVYDFRRPNRVSKEQYRGLQGLFEAFGREFSITLPGYLRTVTRVDLTAIDQITYDEFMLSVSRPTSLTIVSMEPFSGSGIIELSPSLVFPVLDRLLGGPGAVLEKPRNLTEIEQRIIQKVIYMALSCWERSWAHVAELKFKILAQESDPLIVQIVPGSEMVILVGFELHIGEVAGTMNVCIPLMNIGPLLEKLSAQLSYSSKLPRDVAAKTRAQVQDVLTRVTVPVTADLGASRLFVRELLSLQEGDILQLDNPVSGYASVRVGDKQKFYAKPGRVGDESAVQIVSSTE